MRSPPLAGALRRRMEKRERRGLEQRLQRLRQLQGELKKEEKDLATKARAPAGSTRPHSPRGQDPPDETLMRGPVLLMRELLGS